MRLRIGSRVPHDIAELSPSDPPEIQRNRAVYRITEVIAESPWGGLYRGRKVFRNFDFVKRCLIEVEDDECLDVLLKTLAYPVIDQREYVSARRDHAWFEAKKVLGCRKTNLIPEPLDFLEVRNDQDGFEFPHAGRSAVREPVMVCEFVYGENLARWRQQNSPDVARNLRVLAELLELINVLHGQHVLMNNVGPAAFWADEMDRVHFVGTENVIDESKAAAWRMLFPPERYARGFAAPELCEPGGAPSRESDLFGWAGLAYFLITGESPAALAVQQQRKSPRFGPPQRERLKTALDSLERSRLPDFMSLFEIGGSRFEKTWPDSFVEVLLACLHEERDRRPPDVPSLRHWWQAAPPAPVPVAVGVCKNGRLRLVFSTSGLADSLRYVVRRQIGETPRSVNAGIEVWSGDSARLVEDDASKHSVPHGRGTPPSDWRYGVFTIDDRDGTNSVSRAAPVRIFVADTTEFAIQVAEELADSPDLDSASDAAELPATLDLLGQLEGATSLATQLFRSQREAVRAWSVEVLRRHLQRLPYDQDCRAVLLNLGLRDLSDQVRQKSAMVAVQTAPTCDLSFVIDLATRLGGNAIEDRIRAARGLASMGVPPELSQQATRALEADRPVPCRECGQSVRAGDLDEHLIEIHAYIAVEGKALPLKEGLHKLWSKTLKHFAPDAFAAIGAEFARRHGRQASTALLQSFRQQFQRVNERQLSAASESNLSDYFDRTARTLHSHQLGKSLARHLLTDSDARLRDLGRRYFVPGVVQLYSSDDADLRQFRKSIDFLVPNSAAGERIRFCRLLEKRGANPVVTRQAEQELERERIEPCPECGESMMRRDLGRHRRLRHEVFELDGIRHDWQTLVGRLVDRILKGTSDLFAAQTLCEVHQERFGTEAPIEIARLLIANLNEIEESSALEQIQSAARSLAPLAIGSSICSCALAMPIQRGQVLGLSLFAQLSRCDDLDLARTVAGVSGRSAIPLDIRKSVTENLLRIAYKEVSLCREALMRLAQSAPGDALAKIDLLQSLKQRAGESALVDDVCRQLEEGRRIRCTKCEQVFNGREMADHALKAHGLIFDGRLLRQPWAVAMECLDSFVTTSNPAMLERGESYSKVGSHADRSFLNFIREALRRGIDRRNYRQTLEKAAVDSGESICPSCFSPVADPNGPPTAVALNGQGNLSSPYMRVRRVGDERFVFQYDLELGKRAWTGRQPPMRPTRAGAVLAILGAFWIPALIFALVGFMPTPGAMKFAAGSFSVGAVAAIVALLAYRPRWASVLDFTWSFVTPELLKHGLDLNSTAFLRGLSNASTGQGRIAARRRPLTDLIEELKKDISDGALDPACLSEPLELFRNDLQATKASSAEILRFYTSLVEDLVAARLCLAVFEAVTCGGALLCSLSVAMRIALRWRLYQSAHKQGWTVADVIQLADSSSAIRNLLSAEPPATTNVIAEAWAIMTETRQRNSRPTNATSAIEFVMSSDFKPFRQAPDLLVKSRDGRLAIDSAGLSIDGEHYFSPPKIFINNVTEFVRTGWTYQRIDGGPDLRYKINPPLGYDRVIGYILTINGKSERYKADPAPFVRLIQAYSTFLFERIRPQAAECAHAPPTGKLRRLLEQTVIRCPRCHQSLHFRAGTFAETV